MTVYGGRSRIRPMCIHVLLCIWLHRGLYRVAYPLHSVHTQPIYIHVFSWLYMDVGPAQRLCAYVYSCPLNTVYRLRSHTWPMCIHVISSLYGSVPHDTANVYSCPLMSCMAVSLMCIHFLSWLYIDICTIHTAYVYSCLLMTVYGWMSRTRPMCIHVLSWLYMDECPAHG